MKEVKFQAGTTKAGGRVCHSHAHRDDVLRVSRTAQALCLPLVLIRTVIIIIAGVRSVISRRHEDKHFRVLVGESVHGQVLRAVATATGRALGAVVTPAVGVNAGCGVVSRAVDVRGVAGDGLVHTEGEGG